MFSHEFHFFAPSISQFGELNLPSNKANLIHEILTECHNAPDDLSEHDPTSTVLFDGGRLLYQYPPKANMTFQQYAHSLKAGSISHYLLFNQRVDVVFDTYID